MTDIDFDELDKAVNSALGPRMGDNTDAAATSSESTRQPDAPADEPKKEEPSGEAPKIVITPRRQPLAAPAASRRSGRFMDVVHPSANMAGDKKVTPTSRIKIVPTEDAPKPEEVAKKPAEEESLEPSVPVVEPPRPVETQAPEPAKAAEADDETPEEIVKSDYPDPIDIAGPLSIAEEPPKKEDEPVKEDEEASGPDTPAPKSEPAAGEAPFLPDAKVEKRPLGGFTPEENGPYDEDEKSSESDEEQLPPEAELPAALHSDVVAVESDALPDVMPGQADDEGDEHSEAKEEAPKPEEVKPEKAPDDKPADHETGPAQSIPQQYKSEPASAGEEPRPVFDTDQYHQPLIPAHSGKKNHVWMFILLIVALLAIGGTLGYFAFLSGI